MMIDLPQVPLKKKKMTRLERVNKAHSMMFEALILLSGESMVESIDAGKGHLAYALYYVEQYRTRHLQAASCSPKRINLLTDHMHLAQGLVQIKVPSLPAIPRGVLNA